MARRLTRRAAMRTMAGAAALASTAHGAPAGRAQAAARPPNFVFLISDDHSAPDLGCYGNAAIRTPNLDRMAREGLRFNSAFVSSPQCSPNRSSIFTGCAPHTTNTSRLHTPMPEWEQTFLEPLQARGYFAGAFRKVHQGNAFDRRWDFYGAANVPFEKFFDALPAGRPFFLHVGFTEPHRPYRKGAFSPPHDPARVQVPKYLPDLPEVRADLADYYDEIARMDGECGRVFELLKQHGVAGNTLVIFTGDNGMPFPRAKGGCYDAGLRVPMLAWWPGQIEAGVAAELISHIDLPVTWLEAAGIAKPGKMQGRSFLPRLLGQPYTPRAEVFAERNWHDNWDPMRAVRTGRHKLIYNANSHVPYHPALDLFNSPTWQAYLRAASEGKLSPLHMRLLEHSRPAYELYDVERDPDEFHNLATDPEYANLLEDLKYRLSDWMHATHDFFAPIYRGFPARENPGRVNRL